MKTADRKIKKRHSHHILLCDISGLDRQLNPVLRILQSEGGNLPGLEREQGTLVPGLNLSRDLGHLRIEHGPKSQHASRGDEVLDDTHALSAVV